MSIKRYNGVKRGRVYRGACLVDVDGPDYDFSLVGEEDCLKPENSGKLPAYLMESVVDKTFYNPTMTPSTYMAQVGARNGVALYDTDASGKMPDVDINLGWLRSPARDRTELDLAAQVIKNAVEKAKAADKEQLEAMVKEQESLDKLSDAVAGKKAKAASQSDTGENVVGSV